MPNHPGSAAEPELAFLGRYRGDIIGEMRRAFDAAAGDDVARPLAAMLRYHLGWADDAGRPLDSGGGKLLRPSLLLLCAEAAGGARDDAIAAAAAIELLHNFTLIHDDIEDRSDLRHGRPTLWRRFGVPLAVNAGDGLWAIAHTAMHRLGGAGMPPERVLAAMRTLDDACVALCQGQDADLRFEGDTAVSVDDYLAMARGKTGALMAASAACGAILAGADAATVRGLHEFGLWLGQAFQIRDDWLGIWGDPQRTGKAAAEDLRERKLSYPVVHALEHASAGGRARLAQLYAAALDDAAVGEAMAIVEHAGSREAAAALTSAAATRAIALLAPLALAPHRRDELAGLATYAANRHR